MGGTGLVGDATEVPGVPRRPHPRPGADDAARIGRGREAAAIGPQLGLAKMWAGGSIGVARGSKREAVNKAIEVLIRGRQPAKPLAVFRGDARVVGSPGPSRGKPTLRLALHLNDIGGGSRNYSGSGVAVDDVLAGGSGPRRSGTKGGFPRDRAAR